MSYEHLMRNLPRFADTSDAMKYTRLQEKMLPEPELERVPAYEHLMPNLPRFEDITDAMKYTRLQEKTLSEPELSPNPPEIEDVVGSRKVMTEARYRFCNLIGVLILIIGMLAACFQPMN